MVTAEEQGAVQEENFKDDARFWETMRDMGAASVEEHKALIARAETKIAEETPRVADADEKVEAAKSRLEKLKRGESVSGLDKKFDVVAAMKAAGWTPSMMRHARLLASLTEAELKQAISRAHVSGAVDRAVNREVRRIIRARRE